MSNISNYILVYVEYKIQMDFFMRFIRGLEESGYGLIFITNKLSLKYFLARRNVLCYLIKRNLQIYNEIDIHNSIEILNKQINILEGHRLFSAVYNMANKIYRGYRISHIFFINGEKVADYALKYFAKKNSLKTLFFELSNIPGKIFVDPKGTNANSLLYDKIYILEKYFSPYKEFITWKKKYLEIAHVTDVPPQAKTLRKINNPLLFVDVIGHTLLNVPKNKKEHLFKKLYSKINLRKEKKKKSKKIDFNYIFLPTQIASDTQLKVHSNYTNEYAIKYALNLTNKNNVQLVVKIHPAEFDKNEVIKILSLSKKNGFIVSKENTFDLLINAKSIVTVNSTVGLQGLILGKKVTFLGKTFFKFLNEGYLKNYLLGYLIDIDFFEDENLSEKDILKILSRADSNRK